MWGFWDKSFNEFYRYYSLDYSKAENGAEGLILYNFSTKEAAEDALSLRQELCEGLYESLKVKEIPSSEPMWKYF